MRGAAQGKESAMQSGHAESGHSLHHYRRLAVMTVLSFISMYIFMYAMVDKFSNVYSNLNQLYMAGVMTAPMVLIELAVMGAMYKDKKLNAIIAVVSVIALVAFFAMIRLQTFVGDKEFLRSMIPHHAGAVLMCERASVRDDEIKKLCQTIIAGQQEEIAQMKAKLGALEK
jgi:uncharacterized protein (DUF305 family)